jgi:hypothetical protein
MRSRPFLQRHDDPMARVATLVLHAARDARRAGQAIQEAAGHVSLTTTLKYMHLAPRVLAV